MSARDRAKDWAAHSDFELAQELASTVQDMLASREIRAGREADLAEQKEREADLARKIERELVRPFGGDTAA